jgi:hypothetical protein|tara:strand:- start:382 stop:864 length:483 start_codon:yes stop_codon:yes gene_type:complete
MVEKILWILGFTCLLGLSRIIPHPPNFTPILAVAVFVPLIMKNNLIAIPVTLGAMLIGDLYWGFHSYMFWTYGAVLLATQLRYRNVFGNALLASTIFFLITNFSVWLSGYYGLTLTGLWACYVAAIPFFGNTLMGTLFYTGVFWLIRLIVSKRLTSAYTL